jgi:hypothetical protein
MIPGVTTKRNTTSGGGKNRVIHFGQFMRWHRVNGGKTTDAYARQLGLTARRLIAIEAMAEPAVQHTTLAALARSMDMTLEEFDQAWRTTPVPVTDRKPGPSTDPARRFTAACGAVGISTAEGLRRLRLWVNDQPPETQRAVLSYTGEGDAPEPRFTKAVDHLQDPARLNADRIGERARQSAAASAPAAGGRPASSRAKSRGSAATAGSKRR